MINKILLDVLFTIFIPFTESKVQDSKEPQSQNTPAKIDKTLTLDIGCIKQVVEIRTDDARKPVLFFLSNRPGKPSSSMKNGTPAFTSILKSKFTIVQWGQRDAGETLKLNSSFVQPSVALMERDTL